MQDDITFHHLDPENASLLEGANVFDNPVDPIQLASFVDDPGHEMVFAMARQDVVGMASGTILLHPDKSPAFFVNEVGVNEDMRLRGIGTKLSQRLLAVARARGCKGVWLATEQDNLEARALYQKLEARETDCIVVYDWDGAMDADF